MGILKLPSIISFFLVAALLFAGGPNLVLAQEFTPLIGGDGGFGISNATNQSISVKMPAVQAGPPFKSFLPSIRKKLNPEAPPDPSPPPRPSPPPEPLPPPLLATDGNTDITGVIYGSGDSGRVGPTSKSDQYPGLNLPPVQELLLSPFGATFNNTPTFRWDHASDAMWYCLWIKDSKQRGWLWVKASEVCSSLICSVQLDESLPDGDATWWVIGYNKDGFGPWSSGMNFSINGHTPGAVTLITPSGPTFTSTPTFKWHRAEYATWYKFWIDDSTTLGSHKGKIVSWATSDEVGCDPYRSEEPNDTCGVDVISLADGPAKWWVKACSHTNDCGPWSSPLSFNVSVGPLDPIVGLWNTGEGGQALMEERDSGAYKFVAKVTKVGTWWSSRGIIMGEEVWMLNKDPDGRYRGQVLVKGNFYWYMPFDVKIQGNQMIDNTGKLIATKVQ